MGVVAPTLNYLMTVSAFTWVDLLDREVGASRRSHNQFRAKEWTEHVVDINQNGQNDNVKKKRK